MATIGTFTSTGNGFTGTVRTLALNAKAKLVRVENPSDKGPHFRIFAGNVELGAAWQKTAKDTERDYPRSSSTTQLPGSDLRHPDRGGRPGRPSAHLVVAVSFTSASMRVSTEADIARTALSHFFDAAERAPSTASNCHMAQRPRHVRSCTDNELGFYYARRVISSRP